LAHQGSRRQNAFCGLLAQATRSCSACLQMQQRVRDNVNGVPCTKICVFGLGETAVGVKVGQETIAYLQTGQVFFKSPTLQQSARALRQLTEWGVKLDAREVVCRYNETPVVKRNEYEARVRLLQFFADQLGSLANQVVLQRGSAEPAQITRDRQFIEANYQEALTLALVARHAAMSRYYFCKVFRKATGENFNRYVSRLRVEKAKNLLLNLNHRVSEIAFAVGFQSLTHFNRMFKSIAGRSPTDYRQHLPDLSLHG